MSHYARALESIVLSDPADLLGVETEQTEQTEQAEQTEQMWCGRGLGERVEVLHSRHY